MKFKTDKNTRLNCYQAFDACEVFDVISPAYTMREVLRFNKNKVFFLPMHYNVLAWIPEVLVRLTKYFKLELRKLRKLIDFLFAFINLIPKSTHYVSSFKNSILFHVIGI